MTVTLRDIVNVLMVLIPGGAVARIVYCLFCLIGADDEAPMYKKRIKNALVFLVIAVCAWGLKDIFFYYYAQTTGGSI